ncbi:hypothetical protein C882_4195 [Caenispirillum salinarum AK4]|uniref:Uncharacterized protein n=1 Tax=Caenispirillum salinarum AK4 TaxID=1238182 RepID=K9HKF9_9PROT|nr:hypothetical protein C882_4195 [Caenispirillum salinarum AK4]
MNHADAVLREPRPRGTIANSNPLIYERIAKYRFVSDT